MSEDVSAYMRLSITVWMTAAFLAVVCNVLVMGMSIMNNYADKYTYNLAQGYLQNLISLQQEKYVAAPICHTAIDQAADQVAMVILKDDLNGNGSYSGTVTINSVVEPEIQLIYSYDGRTSSNYYSYNPSTCTYVSQKSNHQDNIVLLMTKYKLENLKVTVTPHNKLSGMYIVELEVVK